MNRTLKRVLGTAGAVAVGLAGAVTFGSAAQAHHPELDGTVDCADDGWTVTWTVWDWEHGDDIAAGVLSEAYTTPEASLGDEVFVGATLPQPSETPLTAVQTFGADVPSVTLNVTAEWPNTPHSESRSKTVYAPTDCQVDEEPTPEPGLEVWSDCFGINVYAANFNAEALAEFTFEPSNGETVTVTPEVDEEYFDYFTVEDPEAGLSVTVSIDGELVDTYDWTGGDYCEWGVIWETCEGLEFELTIPEDAVETTFTFTPSNGEEQVVTLAPGESETLVFNADGSDELTVAYTIEDGKNYYEGEAPWTKPAECEEEVPPTTPVAEEKLPTTGNSMTIMISAAAALVAAAAVLFFIARRRRAVQDW